MVQYRRKGAEYLRFCELILKTILVTAIFILTFFVTVIKVPYNKLYPGYNSVIQDKFRILQETSEPKIIICSGSSNAFGLKHRKLEEATGYKVANLGVHAGFGQAFMTELSKANINKGDIVLLGFEYNWMGSPDGEDGVYDLHSIDPKLVMSGIDSSIDMYFHLPMWMWDDILGNLFSFIEVKRDYKGATGVYSREAFDDQTFQMIWDRPETVDDMYENNKKAFDKVNAGKLDNIDDESIGYLIEYKEYVKKKGASVYLVAPPIYAGCLGTDVTELDRLLLEAEERTGIKCISKQSDYIFPNELMYNATYHCNNDGELKRTELLIEDMAQAGLIGQ